MERCVLAVGSGLGRRKPRSLSSANDAKAGEQSVFSKIHTMHLERHNEPYDIVIWTLKWSK
jgi:hypothetical protein